MQFKADKYGPLLSPTDKPAIWLNTDIMGKMRPQQEKFYYDPTKFKNYMEQLGINYEDFAKVK